MLIQNCQQTSTKCIENPGFDWLTHTQAQCHRPAAACVEPESETRYMSPIRRNLDRS